MIIHRALSIRVSENGFHWINLCDRGFSSYERGLTWNNEEVTCPKCREILEDSSLIQKRKEHSMNQLWVVLTQEGVKKDKIVMNVMSNMQRNELLADRNVNVVFQFQLGCDDIRIHNIDMSGKNTHVANWFDRILLAGDIYQVTEKGSLIHRGKEDV